MIKIARRIMYCVLIFGFIVLLGFLFVETMSGFTWMEFEMDKIIWAVLYFAGVEGVCLYLLLSNKDSI